MTRTIDRPDLWGIGCFPVGDELVTFPVGQTDLERDIGSALKATSRLGFGAGTRTLIVSRQAEAAQYWPFQIAALATGTKLSAADSTRFDAFRVAMFLRQSPYDTVLGVTTDTLDGLEEDLGLDLATVFGGAVVGAHPGAAARLRAADVTVRDWIAVGPTIAVACEAGSAHVDGDEWALHVRDGELRISARRSRAATVDDQPTGLRGTAGDGCACGADDPYLTLDA